MASRASIVVPPSVKEWALVVRLLELDRPVLLVELLEEFELSRVALNVRLDRLILKGWIESVPPDSESLGPVVEAFRARKPELGRRPSLAYRSRMTPAEAGEFQARRCLDEWQLCEPSATEELVRTLRAAFVAKIQGKRSS